MRAHQFNKTSPKDELAMSGAAGSISTITLRLGNKCNFKCRHCIQRHDPNQVPEGLPVRREVFEYIRQQALLYKHKTNNPLLLKLWAGEPLLYWDQIKEIISELKHHPIRFISTTNGSLLTEEIVDFVNDHDFILAISNDGPNTDKVRLVDVFKIPRLRHLIRKLKIKGASLVFHAYSQDLLSVWDYHTEIFGEMTPPSMEFILPDREMPMDIVDFDIPRLEREMNQIISIAIENTKQGKISVPRMFVEWCARNYLANLLYPPDDKCLRCRQVFHAIGIDCNGVVYPCHNQGEPIADISVPHKKIIQIYTGRDKTTDAHEKCNSCKYFVFCRGDCPYVVYSPQKDKSCEARYVVYASVIEYINWRTNYEDLLV